MQIVRVHVQALRRLDVVAARLLEHLDDQIPLRPQDGVVVARHARCRGRFRLQNGVFARLLPDEQHLSHVDAYNVTLQRELTNTISAEIAYVGNTGRGFIGDGPAADALRDGLLSAAAAREEVLSVVGSFVSPATAARSRELDLRP